eukprot:CAMPEP_0171218456 /NCGR_PEP_ID=MMETSP0790-20130122/33211_1 /TAXON_ID=2925 /ORGANISM="Alexandrium catenella, Strain OF101" /LENGTH=299 /DNA_ID=CAMNT_0011684279 /DNA_START=21 /DNA_END=917 /DNA_ORIENTATION=+
MAASLRTASALPGACFLVTGAARGIGAAVARHLSAAGARVAATDHPAHAEGLAALAREVEGIVATPLGDVTVEADRRSIVDAAQEAAGSSGLRGLVNNAGIGVFSPLHGGSEPEEVRRCFEVNAAAPLRLAQLFAEARVARHAPGAIVNVSSQASSICFPNHTAYSVSKAAVDQVTRHLAVELGPHGVRANAVLPTVVLTEMGRTAWPEGAPETSAMLSKIPMGRFAEPEDIASVVAFLLDDARSGMVNGALLPVDGGFFATADPAGRVVGTRPSPRMQRGIGQARLVEVEHVVFSGGR